MDSLGQLGHLILTPLYYAISAVDLSGNESALSAQADATVLDTTPPAVPTTLKAIGVGTGIQLGWTASGDSDLSRRVEDADPRVPYELTDLPEVLVGIGLEEHRRGTRGHRQRDV